MKRPKPERKAHRKREGFSERDLERRRKRLSDWVVNDFRLTNTGIAPARRRKRWREWWKRYRAALRRMDA